MAYKVKKMNDCSTKVGGELLHNTMWQGCDDLNQDQIRDCGTIKHAIKSI